MDRIKQLLITFPILINLSIAEAIPIPAGATQVTERTIFGHITSIYLDQNLAPSGDVSTNSAFSGEYLVYKDPDYNNELKMILNLIFHGSTEDYSFDLDFGPPSWGEVSLNIDQSLDARFTNNFDSNGLEDEFNHGNGYDYGGLVLNIDDYTSLTPTGHGNIYWAGVDIDFTVGALIPVPATIWLFSTGLFGFAYHNRRKVKS